MHLDSYVSFFFFWGHFEDEKFEIKENLNRKLLLATYVPSCPKLWSSILPPLPWYNVERCRVFAGEAVGGVMKTKPYFQTCCVRTIYQSVPWNFWLILVKTVFYKQF